MQEDTIKHSSIYINLPQSDKDICEAVITFLSNKTIADMKHILSTIRIELDFRGSLSR